MHVLTYSVDRGILQKKNISMSGSILDKVIIRKEDQMRQTFDPVQVIQSLLSELEEKEADVVKRRYGLTENGKETLENIGTFYNVTRERIRQIENISIEKIKNSQKFDAIIKPMHGMIQSILNARGGVISEKSLLEEILAFQTRSDVVDRYTKFILSELLSDVIRPLPKKDGFVAGWALHSYSLDFVSKAIGELKKMINNEGTPLSFEELYSQYQETTFFQENQEKFSEQVVKTLCDVSAEIAKNPFDEYGMAAWGLINPKRMHDRVYLILQKEKEPMHFEEIAARIKDVFNKKAYPPTVHNELILNKEYVLVGRGIYALREWGYKEGVVATVIADVLKTATEPMSRDQIVEEVLKQRIVKVNTIHLALTDKKQFKRTADDKYSLNSGTDISNIGV